MAPGLGDYIATKELRSQPLKGLERKEKTAKSHLASVKSLATSHTDEAQAEEEANVFRADYDAPLSDFGHGHAVNRLTHHPDETPYIGRIPTPGYADSYPATTSGHPTSASPSAASASQAGSSKQDESSLDGVSSTPTPSRRPLEPSRNLSIRPPRLAFPRHHVQKRSPFQQPLQSPIASIAMEPEADYEDGTDKQGPDEPENNDDVAEVRPQKKGSVPIHQLDYPVDELYNLDFEALQDESFDYDPRAQRIVIEGISDDMALADRMSLVQKMPAEQQRQFIATLNADEWEQAGHWFETEFARLNACAVKCRQEKRELARKHEEMVYQRYAAVKEESDQLQKICDDMAQKGKEVIRLATPDLKSRQSRNEI